MYRHHLLLWITSRTITSVERTSQQIGSELSNQEQDAETKPIGTQVGSDFSTRLRYAVNNEGSCKFW